MWGLFCHEALVVAIGLLISVGNLPDLDGARRPTTKNDAQTTFPNSKCMFYSFERFAVKVSELAIADI